MPEDHCPLPPTRTLFSQTSGHAHSSNDTSLRSSLTILLCNTAPPLPPQRPPLHTYPASFFLYLLVDCSLQRRKNCLSAVLTAESAAPGITPGTQQVIRYCMNVRTSIYLFRSNRTAFAVLESKPVVGSSRNKMAGSVISSIPILVLFLSPPDTPRVN